MALIHKNNAVLQRQLSAHRRLKQLSSRAQRQQGIALIMAILVVAIVTVIATTLIIDNRISTKRIYRQINDESAQAYFTALEALAIKALKHDLEKDQISDSCKDIWAKPVMQSTIDGEGKYGGYINDLGGRFNLNSIVVGGVTDTVVSAVPYTAEQARFTRLLKTFEHLGVIISDNQAMRITAALIDWLDSDDIATAGIGAEKDYYLQQGFHEMPANQPMVDVSEFLMVLQVLENPALAGKLYELLAPSLTVWPLYAGTLLNVNSAPVAIMRSLNVRSIDLSPPISVENYQQIEKKLGLPYDESMANFVENLTQAYNMVLSSTHPIMSDGLAIRSNIFELSSFVTLGDLTTRMYTVLERRYDMQTQKATVRVLARNRDGFDIRFCH